MVPALLLIGCAPAEAAPGCTYVEEGYGPEGSGPLRVETVVSGLEVPWGLAFLSDGDLLVTERPGRVRLVRDGELVDEPVATIPTAARGEGGLLGLELAPDARAFYVYVTVDTPEGPRNQVERWTLSGDATSAERDRVVLDGIPAARYHDGGRIAFGPDGMLYAGTGDSQQPELAQDRDSLAGKLLRVDPDGGAPQVVLLGLRNTQGFDWLDDGRLVIADHGPSGDFGLTGLDEVSVARPGDNLGWPLIQGCETREGLVAPALSWNEAVPPGSAALWRGDVWVPSLGARHLHQVDLAPDGSIDSHAVWLRGELGRLRTARVGPDGALYVTTSNCDGRGDCPDQGDRIVRITPEEET